jgi:hypothetical protein
VILALHPRRSALLGAALWIGLLVADLSGGYEIGLLPLLFLLAPLVIVPLGLSLLRRLLPRYADNNILRVASLLQPIGALLAASSFFFQPSRTAGLLALPWLVGCLLLALSGFNEFVRGAYRSIARAAGALSLLYISVGGVGLVASRLGLTPMGFEEPIVLLTAVHFHYAGFAAPIMLLALSRATPAPSVPRNLALRIVAVFVLVGPAALAAAFLIGPRAKLAAAIAVAVGESGLALFTLSVLPHISTGVARTLLAISSVCAFLGMTLASLWAIGEYPLQPFLDLSRMVQVHGVLNSLGFVLCGLLGWSLASSRASVEMPGASHAGSSLDFPTYSG